MSLIQRLLSLCIFLLGWPLLSHAQTPLHQGQIIYRADTVRRLEARPANYIPTQFVATQQDRFTRLELKLVNRFNPADTQTGIQIRNAEGIYTWLEVTNSMLKDSRAFALFTSYEEEKQQQARALSARANNMYRTEKTVQNILWLGLPAEKIALTKGADQQKSEAIITRAVSIPIWGLFDFLRYLPGTPLQFINEESGWATRFTATAISKKPLSAQLFVVDPKRKVMTEQEAKQKIADMP